MIWSNFGCQCQWQELMFTWHQRLSGVSLTMKSVTSTALESFSMNSSPAIIPILRQIMDQPRYFLVDFFLSIKIYINSENYILPSIL